MFLSYISISAAATTTHPFNMSKRKADSQPADEQPKKLARAGTMATTVAESQKIVGKAPLGERKAKKPAAAAKPVEEEAPQKLSRASTIQQTLESSKRVLKDGELGERKAKKAAADKKEAEKQEAEKKKKAAAADKKKDDKPKEKLARAGTMATTVAESHKIIGKDGELGERKAKKAATEATTSPASSPRKKGAAAAKPAAAKPKKAADKPKKAAEADNEKLSRAGTMATTVAESQKILGKEPLGERKAKKPAAAAAAAAPAAAAEGKRAARGKKKADADA